MRRLRMPAPPSGPCIRHWPTSSATCISTSTWRTTFSSRAPWNWNASMPAPGQPERALPLGGDTRVYELRLARLLMAISQRQAALAVSPAWLQAHGHAEVLGWVGSFILGIGFHSLTRPNQARV